MSQENKKRYKCDLHCHTTRSDGNDTPKELIDNAISLGMKAIAITDHDIVPPETIKEKGRSINITEYAKIRGLNLVPGYEFSTDTFIDDVHIIGYDMDWYKPIIQEEMRKARESKTNAYKKLCKVLTEKGRPINYEEEILCYKDESGSIKTRNPDDVERKFIFEKMAEKGFVQTWEEAKILVRDNSELNIRRRKIDPLDALDLIHFCGGIAILAHPYLIDEYVESPTLGRLYRENYIERLINNGLDGIEARYTYNKTSYKGDKTVDQIENEIRETYANRLLISGGSDYHAGHKKSVKNPRKIGEAGITMEEFSKIFEDRIEIV